MKLRIFLPGLMVIAVLVVFGYLLGDVVDRDWIDTHVQGRGLTGELLFVGVGGLLASIGLSRQVIAFLGGYGFGFLAGALLGTLAALLGCLLSFSVSRLLGRSWLTRHYSGRIRKIDNFIHANPFSMTLLVRLLPLGSNWMVNLAAGVSGVRPLPFFLGSALGYVPQMLVFALIGSGTQVEQFWQVAIAIALFVVATLLGMYLYRRYRHGHVLDTALDHELGLDAVSAAPGSRRESS
ncbi:MAG: VTT domain-containing protein [Gammaproteobacteria bacterium]|nr:VTT domain-containing protein [Gammaproteobacteria bacterium]MDH3559830.1 VTT domain-containing protein [Gammaproteobacteria bacterium]